MFPNEEAAGVIQAIREVSGVGQDAADDMEPNEAKLRLAVTYNLRAIFAYHGDRDYRPVKRRLEPQRVFEKNGVTYVAGTSYDDGGDHEGTRCMRLDRIHGQVVIR